MVMKNIGIPALLAPAVLAIAAVRVGFAEEPPVQGGGGEPTGSRATTERTIRELRGLVAELEIHVEQQDRQIESAKRSLSRARDLLHELEADPEAELTLPGQQGRRSPSWFANGGRLRDQTAAEETAWRWSDERSELEFSLRELGGGYKARTEPIPESPEGVVVALMRDGKDVFSWRGHQHSVFVVAQDVLYLADFSSIASGCTVLAHDLKEGKLLWRTPLRAIPVGGHSQYWNRINLDVDDRHVTVYGKEGFGRYLELLDRKSGKSVGYRLIDVADGLVPREQ